MEVILLLKNKITNFINYFLILIILISITGEEFSLFNKSFAAASSGVQSFSSTRNRPTSSATTESGCRGSEDPNCYDLAGSLNEANVDTNEGRKFIDGNLSMHKISENATFADFQKYFGYGWQALKFIIRAAEMKSTIANQDCRVDNIFFTMFDQFGIASAALRLANFGILIDKQIKLTNEFVDEIEQTPTLDIDDARNKKMKHRKFLEFLIKLQVISVEMALIDWAADVIDLVSSGADLVAAFIDLTRVANGHCVPKPPPP